MLTKTYLKNKKLSASRKLKSAVKACLIRAINEKTTGLCKIRLLNCCKSYCFCDRPTGRLVAYMPILQAA